MSYFSDKSRDECWVFFDRHLAFIPNTENRAQARQYLLEREENVTYSTLGNYLQHIKSFGLYLGKRSWNEATREDVILAIKEARGKQGRTDRTFTGRGKPLAPYTKYQRMVMLREFYKWLQDTTDTPPQFKRMPFVKPSLEEQYATREDRLSKEEIMDMLATTQDHMERALVMTLLDSGFRAGEASALNIENVEFDDHGARLTHSKHAKGLKTKRRKVPTRLIVAAPYLRDWIAVHPHRLHPEWPLFISRSHRNRGARLSGSAIWAIIDRLSRAAKIRHVHPHMFRHTAASLRSGDGWNEEMLRLHFGWSKGSEMPSFYSHVEQDYDAFALRRAGIPVKRSPGPEWTLKCQKCGHENPGDAYFCTKCEQPLEREP